MEAFRSERGLQRQGYAAGGLGGIERRLAQGDLRVEWTDGAAERDEARLWREVDEVLERAVGAPLVAPADQAAAAPASDSDAAL